MNQLTRNQDLESVAIQAQAYAAQSRAPNTARAYHSDWEDFSTWCKVHALSPLPATPETIILYLTDQASRNLKVSTISRRLTTIRIAHKAAGHPSPADHAAVDEVWRGIRRSLGTSQKGKTPILVPELRDMIVCLDTSTSIGLRDRAILLAGFAGGFRRSELVALDVEDLELGAEGYTVTLRRSKTDQEGAGRKLGLPFARRKQLCPVNAIEEWLEASAIATGPIFRTVDRHGHIGERLTPQGVAIVVKRCAEAAGLDPSRFSGHSLRRGLATAAAMAGASERAIMKQTGHKSGAMVRRYIEDAELFRDNAAGVIL